MNRSTTGARAARLTTALVAALLLAPGAASAQPTRADSATLAGTVSTTEGAPIAGATVTMLKPRAADATPRVALTNDAGTFRFAAPTPGVVVLQVRRIGFQSETLAVRFPLPPDDAELVVLLRPLAQTLAPVIVRADRNPNSSPIAGFYHRREVGAGHYLTHDDIVRRAPQRTTDLFRMVPGLRMVRGGAGAMNLRLRGNECDPAVWIDGMPLGPAAFDFDALTPGSIEGMEIYGGPASAPAEFSHALSQSICGTVLVWTREGERKRRRKASTDTAITSDGLAALIASAEVFTSDQVDRPAMAQEDVGALFRYPEELRSQRLAADGVVEFVVDAEGAVEPATINFVSPPPPAFAAAVRSALPEGRFSAAVRRGMPVRQLVQLAFHFAPPTVAERDARAKPTP